MDAKRLGPGALVLALLGPDAQAQTVVPGQSGPAPVVLMQYTPPPAPTSSFTDPSLPLPGSATPPGEPSPSGAPDQSRNPPAATPGPTGLFVDLPKGVVASPWVQYQRENCCGPVGLDGPINTELYFYSGPSFIVGGGEIFESTLQAGWMTGGGGRSIVFDKSGTAAWTVDLGVSYSYNNAGSNQFFFQQQGARPQQIGNPVPVDLTLSVRGLNRTSANLSLGRRWYLLGPGTIPGCESMNLCYGVDLGGRWGTSHADLNIIAEDGVTQNPVGYLREHDVFGSIFTTGYVNVEVPCGGWVFFGGLMAQYDYTWSDIIRAQDSDIEAVNLLFTIGARY